MQKKMENEIRTADYLDGAKEAGNRVKQLMSKIMHHCST